MLPAVGASANPPSLPKQCPTSFILSAKDNRGWASGANNSTTQSKTALHNNGYLIGRLLCHDPDIEYNDLAPRHDADLPKALGCDDWFTAFVTTCGEFEEAQKAAQRNNCGAYIEVVTEKYAASPLSMKLPESEESLHKP
jgi:TPP-dependent 2-oxoacid decarboxylase